MSLDWNVGGIENWHEVCETTAKHDRPMDGIKKGDKVWNPVTLCLAWACLHVELGAITTENYYRFYVRVATFEAIAGPFLDDPNNHNRRITLDEIKAHIGFTTNVTTTTPKRFEDKMARIAKDREQSAERIATYKKNNKKRA